MKLGQALLALLIATALANATAYDRPLRSDPFSNAEWEKYRKGEKERIEKYREKLNHAQERVDRILDIENRMFDANRDLRDTAVSMMNAAKDNATGKKLDSYIGAIGAAKDLSDSVGAYRELAADQLDLSEAVAEVSRFEQAIKEAQKNIDNSKVMQQAIKDSANNISNAIKNKKKVEFILINQSGELADQQKERRERDRRESNSDNGSGGVDKPRPGEIGGSNGDQGGSDNRNSGDRSERGSGSSNDHSHGSDNPRGNEGPVITRPPR